MIIRKSWRRDSGRYGYRRGIRNYVYTGWFLLGIIPLYVRRITVYY